MGRERRQLKATRSVFGRDWSDATYRLHRLCRLCQRPPSSSDGEANDCEGLLGVDQFRSRSGRVNRSAKTRPQAQWKGTRSSRRAVAAPLRDRTRGAHHSMPLESSVQKDQESARGECKHQDDCGAPVCAPNPCALGAVLHWPTPRDELRGRSSQDEADFVPDSRAAPQVDNAARVAARKAQDLSQQPRRRGGTPASLPSAREACRRALRICLRRPVPLH